MTKTLFSATTRDVCDYLDLGPRCLKRLRDQGYLVAGKHFRHVGVGTIRPRIRWNLAAVEEAITNRSRRLRLDVA